MVNKVFIIIVILLCISGCKDSVNPNVEVFTISNNGIFSQSECAAKGLNDKVIMISSKYCTHCKNALPVFLEAVLEVGIEPIIWDIADSAQRTEMYSYGVDIQYTPTFIFNCEYFIGEKSKEELLTLLK